MDMQDKEFDELFRTKLDGFEAEPSARVWPAIINRLDGRVKRLWAPVLSIAASIVVLVTAWILFIPQKHRIIKPHEVKNSTAIAATSNVHLPGKNSIKSGAPIQSIKPASNVHAANRIAAQHQQKKPNTTNTPFTPVQNAATHTGNDELIAATPANRAENIKAVVPDMATQLSIKQLPDQSVTVKTPAPQLAAAQPVRDKQDSVPVAAKHRVHGLGGLLNAVLAKVDKRSDKLIHFGDSDDDESNITGVNLGIIKIKKEK